MKRGSATAKKRLVIDVAEYYVFSGKKTFEGQLQYFVLMCFSINAVSYTISPTRTQDYWLMSISHAIFEQFHICGYIPDD